MSNQWVKAINGQMVNMTDDEIAIEETARAARASAISAADLVAKAKAALVKTDDTAIRCMKAGVSFPSDWQQYVAALRALVNGVPGSFPIQPQYPSGT